MNFLDRIEPFLISNDLIIQEFVLHALHDYPNVSKLWIEQLVKEALQNEEKRPSILLYLSIDPMHEEVVSLLVEGAKNAPMNNRHLYFQLLFDLEPELVIKHKHELSPFIPNDYWTLYNVLVNGSKEEVWMEYGDILNKLEAEPSINSDLYKKAKKIAYTLVKKGWITEEELERDLEENLQKEWFNYIGILGVYMIGLMKNDKYIYKLVPLLVRDEDILLEEVAATLISFQSDEVVEAVTPYILKEESNIFATSIVENIKTDFAVEVLRNAYHQVEEEDSQAVIIEALVHQLSLAAEPEINNYVSKRPSSFLVDVEQLAYSYYKIIGMDHPLIDEWKLNIQNRDNEVLKEESIPDQPLRVVKVGRNEPCLCGSGKKYKKCCG
ncbi:MAG: YecA family protein [Bacillota bacterium]